MDYFAGLDVSVKETSVCIVDNAGKIVREVRVASEPEALLQVLTNTIYRLKRLGHIRNLASGTNAERRAATNDHEIIQASIPIGPPKRTSVPPGAHALAVASPARTSSTICATVKPCASRIDSVQPSRHGASNSSARRCSTFVRRLITRRF